MIDWLKKNPVIAAVLVVLVIVVMRARKAAAMAMGERTGLVAVAGKKLEAVPATAAPSSAKKKLAAKATAFLPDVPSPGSGIPSEEHGKRTGGSGPGSVGGMGYG